MRILDLFCGAGGASEGYRRAGFEVVGVDLNEQPEYPFEFHQGDALEILQDGYASWQVFDAFHVSPPCQAYSSASQEHKSKHPDLIGPVRELLRATGLPYVIENVPGAPLEEPIQLCGSSFGLDVQRHRLFESNLDLYGIPCHHDWWEPRWETYDHGKWFLSKTVPVYGDGGGKAREEWGRAMGITWMSDPHLKEAIPPAYTEFLGKQVIRAGASFKNGSILARSSKTICTHRD